MDRTILAIHPAYDIFSWEYCPICGKKMIDYYVGDFTSHTVCKSEDCNGVGFSLAEEKKGAIKSLHPKRRNLNENNGKGRN